MKVTLELNLECEGLKRKQECLGNNDNDAFGNKDKLRE